MTGPTLGRADLGDFTVGGLYRHDWSGELVEFVGVASMSELDGEDVAVFRFVDSGGCLIATRDSHDKGETFTPVDAALEEL